MMKNTFSLKNPPSRLELGQRVMIEAVGIAIDTIEFDCEEINQVIEQIMTHGRSGKERDLRLRLFRATWSIVDRIDQIRQVLLNQRERLQLAPDESRRELFEACRAMRNAMDHLGSNEQKYKKKRLAYPIFGMISFSWNTVDDFQHIGGETYLSRRKVTVISASSFQYRYEGNVNDLFQKHVKVGFNNILFFAFDKIIELSDCATVVFGLKNLLEKRLQELGQDNGDVPLDGPLEFTFNQEFEKPALIKLD